MTEDDGRPQQPGHQEEPAEPGEPGPDETPEMRLDDVLKFFGIASTGGHAKHLIQSGEVLVNGEVETRRKRRLKDGDSVRVGDEAFVVEFAPDPDA